MSDRIELLEAKVHWYFEGLLLGSIVTIVGGLTSDPAVAKVGAIIAGWCFVSGAIFSVSLFRKVRAEMLEREAKNR